MTQLSEHDEFRDDEWVAARPRVDRRRMVLLLALSASLVFLMGVQAQKHFGQSSSSSSTALPSGFPALGGAGPPAGGAGAPTANGATSGGAGTASPGTSGTSPAVIGTVISKNGNVWTVKDLGGKKHTVTVSASTVITQQASLTAQRVRNGATVTISGSEDTSGKVSASSITVR